MTRTNLRLFPALLALGLAIVGCDKEGQGSKDPGADELSVLEDMEAAPASPADTPEAPAETRYHTVLDVDALEAMMARLEVAELICVDTETDSLSAMASNLVGLSFAVEPGELL